MEYKEILELLKSNLTVEEFAYQDFDEIKLGLGEIEEIDQVGGEEEGSHWHSVKYLKNHDIYIKVTGWYSSYHGTDFDGWNSAVEQVKPIQKTIIVYE